MAHITNEISIDELQLIFDKLNMLNSKIVKLYFKNYRSKIKKYNEELFILPDAFNDDVSNIDLSKAFINSDSMEIHSEGYLAKGMPVYYKMLCLYAHFITILKYLCKMFMFDESVISSILLSKFKELFAKTYSDELFAIINSTIHNSTVNKTLLYIIKRENKSILVDLNDEQLEFIRSEIRVLMRLSNELNSHVNDLQLAQPERLYDYHYMMAYKYTPVESDGIVESYGWTSQFDMDKITYTMMEAELEMLSKSFKDGKLDEKKYHNEVIEIMSKYKI